MSKKKEASGNKKKNSKENEKAEYLTEEQQEETREPEEAVSESDDPEPAEVLSLSPDETAKIVQEKEEYYDRLLRTQADFDNYRKRVQKEQSNLLRYGAEKALYEILPIVDNLERAVDSARKHADSNSQLRDGIELILNQFFDVLGKLGVSPIESVGSPFDPNKHDALLRVHTPDSPEGMVVEEIRKGYYLHDKILRPAQVTVGTREPIPDSDQSREKRG